MSEDIFWILNNNRNSPFIQLKLITFRKASEFEIKQVISFLLRSERFAHWHVNFAKIDNLFTVWNEIYTWSTQLIGNLRQPQNATPLNQPSHISTHCNKRYRLLQLYYGKL